MGLGPARVSQEGQRWIVTNAVLFTLAAIAIALRLYARKLRGKKLVFNDYAIVMSVIFSAGFSTVMIIAAAHGGVGFELVEVVETMGYDAIVIMLKCLTASEMLYPVAMALVKVSIVHFYTTIFPNRVFHKIAYVIMALAVVTAIATILDAFLGCRPFAYNWDKMIPGGTCGNEVDAYLVPCIVNLIIDVAVVVLPLPILWTLKMRLLRKIAVSFIFSMGIGVCVVSGIRLKTIYSLDLMNITSSVGDLGFWTALEPLLGIINACLPMLQPIFKAPFSRLNKWAVEREKASVPGSDTRVLQPMSATVTVSSRLFRRLYDHIYPLTESSELDSGSTGITRISDEETLRADSVWNGNGAKGSQSEVSADGIRYTDAVKH